MTRPTLPFPPALLDAPHAAAYLSLSATTLRRLADEGRAPAPVRVGGRVLWRRGDLDAWAASLPTDAERADESETCAADRAFQCG